MIDQKNKEAIFRSIKVRRDIQVERQIYDGDPYYVLKDPISLKYFRVKELEYFIFKHLDGFYSIEDIQAAIKEEFSGLSVSEDQIKEFILSLKVMNFLESFGPKAGKILYKRAGLKKKQKLKQTLMSFFFIKVPLVDPDRFFKKVYPYISFIWSKFSFFAWLTLLLAAISIVYVSFPQFLNQIHGFLNPQNFMLIFLAIMVIKTFHEFGHGFTCARYGGEVHELGILFIVFTPWMYCNVSDAWIFKTGRQKFQVSVAGIVAELFVASIATFIWWWTQPGLINTLAYNIIIICSVDNILRNGNPLLRYDGYYALADYLEIPNLTKQSRGYLLYLFKKYILRMKLEDEDLSAKRKRIYVIYGISSVLFRIFIVILIMGFVAKFFFVLGVILAGIMGFGFFIKPLIQVVKFFIANRKDIHYGRLTLTFVFIVPLLFCLLLFYQSVLTVSTSCAVEPAEKVFVRTGAEGYLDELFFNTGDYVEKEKIIGRLSNPGLEADLKRLILQESILEKTKTMALGSNRIVDYNRIETELKRVGIEILKLKEKLSKLKITAEKNGTIFTPRLKERLGDYLQEGDILCEIGDYNDVVVKVIVPESEMFYLRAGQSIELKTYAYPDMVFKGMVTELSPARVQSLDNLALSSGFGGDLPIEIDQGKGGAVPSLPYFQITMKLDNSTALLKPGMTGISKIFTEKKNLFAIVWYKLIRFLDFDFIL